MISWCIFDYFIIFYFLGILSKFTEYCIEYGGIYKIYIPPKLPTLIISDPELIQQLTTTHLEKSLDYKVFKRWIGQGLLTADGKIQCNIIF